MSRIYGLVLELIQEVHFGRVIALDTDEADLSSKLALLNESFAFCHDNLTRTFAQYRLECAG